MRLVFGAICVLALVVGSVGASQAPQKMAYEAFCSLPDAQAKIAAFNQVTPDNRAELVKTQIERWPEANKSRLSPPQLALLDQMHALITPEAYTVGAGQEDARNKMRDLEPKLAELFTVTDRQFMQINAPCLPKGK